jgi:hypothetical protein
MIVVSLFRKSNTFLSILFCFFLLNHIDAGSKNKEAINSFLARAAVGTLVSIGSYFGAKYIEKKIASCDRQLFVEKMKDAAPVEKKVMLKKLWKSASIALFGGRVLVGLYTIAKLIDAIQESIIDGEFNI